MCAAVGCRLTRFVDEHFWSWANKQPTTITSETITQYEGHGVTCDIIFRVTGDDTIASPGISVHVFDTFSIGALTQFAQVKGYEYRRMYQ